MQKNKIVYGSISLFICLLLTSCASIKVHNGGMSYRLDRYDPRLDSPTPIYGGTVKDFIDIGSELASPITSNYQENAHWNEILYFPLSLIDTPFSFIADTIYLPSDIGFWAQWSSREKTKKDYKEESKKTNKEALHPIPAGKEKEYGVWEETN